MKKIFAALFSVALLLSCAADNEDKEQTTTITFSGTVNGVQYELTIVETQNGSAKPTTYTLIARENGAEKTSTGTVLSGEKGGDFVLQPSKAAAPTFTITTGGTADLEILDISGEITYDS